MSTVMLTYTEGTKMKNPETTPPSEPATIRSLQERLREALEKIPALAEAGGLPPALDALRTLAADSGLRAEVTLHHRENGRQIRNDAAATNWDPTHGEIVIRFEPIGDGARSQGEIGGSARSVPREGREALVLLLDKAEKERRFVALKWFRDQVMLELQERWASDPDLRQEAIRKAIEDQLFLTGKTPNPKAPSFPVTTIRLNRSHPEASAARESDNGDFQPLSIRGEGLSDTVLRDRR